MKDLLNRLTNYESLSRDEAKNLLCRLISENNNDSMIAAVLTSYIMRNITTDEILGFRDSMKEMSKQIDLSMYNTIDIVGTGGDHKNTFNISTLASFVVAGAGYHVAKHGNFGSTSVCGASNVLEHLGVRFSSNEGLIQRSLDNSGIAYLHAPLFNDGMKSVANVRKSLGIRTIFNILGPLLNPSEPDKLLLGTYNLEMARLYAYICQQSGQDFLIVNSLDGYDEISLTAPFKVISIHREGIYNPADLGYETYSQQSICGGQSIESSAKIFLSVLDNKATKAQKDCVCINAAFAIHLADPDKSLTEAMNIAEESLLSKKALNAFRKFQQINS